MVTVLRAWALGIAAILLAVLPAPVTAENATASPTDFSIVAVGAEPEPLPLRPTHLGLRWAGDPDALQLRYAVGGEWRPWHDMEAVPDLDDPDRGVRHAGLVRANGATAVQVRAVRGASRPEVVAIDARDAGGYRSAQHMRVSADGGPPGPPPVITRAGWGADESKRRNGGREYARVSKLVVHHTVTPNDDPDPASTVRAIYAYHTQSRGWDDIGYNFLVDAAGRVYEGRFARQYAPDEVPTGENHNGAGVVGAHAQRHNHGSAGVALLGDFHGGQPTPAAIDGLVAVLAWKAARNGIDPHGATPFTTTDGQTYAFPNVAGHRDVGQTQCPGDHLYAALPHVRQRVAERLGKAPPPPPPAPDSPPAPPAPAPAPEPPPPPIPGFWAAHADGSVAAFGDADPPGGPSPGLAHPVVGMAPTPGGRGYWLVAADGTVTTAGDAQVFPPATALPVAPPVVRLEPTPTGAGYWLVSRDGAVVPYGDARWFGSVPAGTVAPVVGMAATPTGAGYWVAAADGRVYSFGDAVTTGGGPGGVAAPPPISAPVTSIAASPTGTGYWLLSADGNVVPVGVPGHGRAEIAPPLRAIQIRATETGGGYYVAATDGALFTLGDAEPRRQRAGDAGAPEVVDVALRPLRRATP